MNKVRKNLERKQKKYQNHDYDISIESLSHIAVRPKLSHCEQRAIQKEEIKKVIYLMLIVLLTIDNHIGEIN